SRVGRRTSCARFPRNPNRSTRRATLKGQSNPASSAAAGGSLRARSQQDQYERARGLAGTVRTSVRLVGLSLIEFLQHFIGRYVERIFLQKAAEDHHRMRSHDVYHNAGFESRQVVSTDDRVVVFRQDMVEPRFILDNVVYAGQ